MCGRYVTPADAAIERHWRVDRRSPQPFALRYNVAPTTIVPVLWQAGDGALELLPARWGLIPHWWSRPRLPTLSFNARSEEAAEKPMWREALRKSRCLMPALGWYEWQERNWQTGEELKVRQPHFIHPASGGPVAFAGLLSWWQPPAGERVLTCALLTKSAAPSVADVHDRMPVVLDPAACPAWLDHNVTAAAEIAALIGASLGEFLHHPVSRQVNNARNDSPELLTPSTVVQ